ncbi:MAG TPA: hypothetical protein VGS10_11840 [Terracidiphilus sp.]|nr:hypothetical protein [Terracidiphilus sp.]
MYKKVLVRLFILWCCFIAMLIIVTHERAVGSLSLAGMQKIIYVSAVLTIVIFWMIIFKVAMEYKAIKREQYHSRHSSEP